MAADYIPNGDKPGKSVMTNAVKEERSRFDELTKGKRHENPYGIQNELATVMMDKVGIFRNKQDMQIACDKIKELKERYKKIRPIQVNKRFIDDSRDGATYERLAYTATDFGIFRCHTIFNCQQVCPKDLDPTGAIQQLKLKTIWAKLKGKLPKPEEPAALKQT